MKHFWIVIFFFTFASCEQIQKKQYAEKVAQQSCQEINQSLIEQASSLVPAVGKLLTDALVPDDIKNGGLCECLKPTLQDALQETYSIEDLKAMNENKAKRNKAALNIIFKRNKEILKCYETKGLKGLKIIEKFFKKILEKKDESV
ncbi:MAG: hypothetical protein NZ519_03160 [Bacteroidia bacterium]|nr:hypothetical protein [Bacteroidia bacterium]MDW8300871.1 hypothetical protein [Bacteroidia bacterium]